MKRSALLLGGLLASPLWAAAGGCGDDRVPDQGSVTSTRATSTTSTSGSTGAGGPRVNFGRACSRAEDCGIELLCLTSDSPSLTKGGPPRGLCTASCDDDPDLCKEFADDARCVQFGKRSYCVEACEYGSSLDGAFDKEKCHGRTEFACKPTPVAQDTDCEDASDCAEGETCDGVCYRDMPTCMPQCNGDSDCDSSLFCDPRSGECIRDLPRGRRLALLCDEQSEPDPCRGSCGLLERPDGARCDETCTLGAYPTCGLVSNPANVGCAIPVVDNAAFGDMGYCAPLCDCSADCPSGLVCVVSEFAYLQRPGFCKSSVEGDAVRSSCGNGGGAGAPGTGATSSSGSGGSSTSSGGTSAQGGQGGQAGGAGYAGASETQL